MGKPHDLCEQSLFFTCNYIKIHISIGYRFLSCPFQTVTLTHLTLIDTLIFIFIPVIDSLFYTSNVNVQGILKNISFSNSIIKVDKLHNWKNKTKNLILSTMIKNFEIEKVGYQIRILMRQLRRRDNIVGVKLMCFCWLS